MRSMRAAVPVSISHAEVIVAKNKQLHHPLTSSFITPTGKVIPRVMSVPKLKFMSTPQMSECAMIAGMGVAKGFGFHDSTDGSIL